MLRKQFKKGQLAGWSAVGPLTVVTCDWAFWTIIEKFHEGWYLEFFWTRDRETGPKFSKGANNW